MNAEPQAAVRSWNEILQPYKRPIPLRSWFQLASTTLLYVAGWALMLKSLEWSYWVTLLLAFPVTGLIIRLFIIQHDCGHGAYFRSRWLADTVGFVIGVVTLIPYTYWRKTHAIHHAGSSNLDAREFGDVSTLTVREYLARDGWGRLKYRLYRHPFSLFVVGPIYQFVFKHRLPLDVPRSWKREWANILWTNLALAGLLFALVGTVGWSRFLLVQAPLTFLTGSVGIWLFYVQHQFEGTYWDHDEEWDFHRAGIEGSSFYDLPQILHWFTGNIGYHHVHHLSSRIPNYLLRRCHEENPELHQVKHLGFWESFRCVRLKLWDESSGQLVGFSDLPQRR